MSTKAHYLLFVFAAVFALMFAFTPHALAESGKSAQWEENGKYMGPHTIQIDGFTGAIPIPETMNKDTHDSLKSQIKVSLSKAVSIAENEAFTDIMMASIGIVDNGEMKYLAWIVSSIDPSVNSATLTTKIFVVDAGNPENFVTTTKTYDHSMMGEKMKDNAYDHSMMGEKMKDNAYDHSMMGEKMKDTIAKPEKFQQFSTPAPNADVDVARAQFLDLTQKLHDAYKNGDSEAAQTIRDQLHELKQIFLDMRNSKF